jgi:hypothetical protein
MLAVNPVPCSGASRGKTQKLEMSGQKQCASPLIVMIHDVKTTGQIIPEV